MQYSIIYIYMTNSTCRETMGRRRECVRYCGKKDIPHIVTNNTKKDWEQTLRFHKNNTDRADYPYGLSTFEIRRERQKGPPLHPYRCNFLFIGAIFWKLISVQFSNKLHRV